MTSHFGSVRKTEKKGRRRRGRRRSWVWHQRHHHHQQQQQQQQQHGTEKNSNFAHHRRTKPTGTHAHFLFDFANFFFFCFFQRKLTIESSAYKCLTFVRRAAGDGRCRKRHDEQFFQRKKKWMGGGGCELTCRRKIQVTNEERKVKEREKNKNVLFSLVG